jgi:hypothetical protein
MRQAAKFIFFLTLIASLAFGQDFYASLSGTVTDPSGAAIPNVSVAARNVGTNITVRAVTGAAGNYLIPQLTTGEYQLTAEAQGFRSYTRQGIHLSVGDKAGVDIPMQIGDATQSVSVTAELATVEANQSVMGLVSDEKVVSEVPLQGRQVFEVLLYSAGVLFTSTAALNPKNTLWEANGEYSINGSRPGTNAFLVDGRPSGARGTPNGSPLVDAVEELKIASPVSDASLGLSGGGVVNLKMKSGTNEIHGSLSEFLQNVKMDANVTQTNRALVLSPYLKNQNTQNSFAARVSGPIVKNRFFYTGHYQGTRMRQSRPTTITMPTLDQRAGDFNTTLNSARQSILVYDPLTTVQTGNTFTRSPFAGNIIPASRIAAPSRNILAFLPTPNLVTDPVTNINNYASVPNSRWIDPNEYYVKTDFFWNERHRSSASNTYSWASNNQPAGNGLPRNNPLRNIGGQTRNRWGATLDHVWIPAASITVNARIGWDRFVETNNAIYQQDFDGSKLGFTGRIGSSPVNRFPVMSLQDYAGWGLAARTFSPDDQYTAVVDASKQSGRHYLKFGTRIAQTIFSRADYGDWYGNFAFNRGFTQRDPQRADTVSGNSVASFLLGYPANGSADVNAQSTYLNKAFGLYFQDDWKITRRLTINAGLRWDVQTAPTERFDRQVYGFDPTVTYQLGPSPATGGFVYADKSNRQPWDTKYRDFQPRTGAAFHLMKRLTLRGGYGISFLPLNGTLGGGGIQQDGFSRTTTMVVTQGAGAKLYTPGEPGMGTFLNPFPTGVLEPFGSALGPKTQVGQSVSYTSRDFQTGRVHQLFFGFGLDLPWKTAAEVSYVGTRTRSLRVTVNENAIPIEEQQKGAQDPNYLNQAQPNPWYGAPELVGTSLNTATLSKGKMVRAFPQFVSVNNTGVPIGNASYNGLEMRIQRRMASGLMVTLNYTFAKNLQALDWREDTRTLPRVLAPFDRTHNLNIITLLTLPFGKGQRIGSNWNKHLNRVLGGWQANMVFMYQNGLPVGMPGAVVVSNPELPEGQQTRNRWFNTCTLMLNGTRSNCASPDEQVAWRQPTPGEIVVNSARMPNIRVHSLPQVNVSMFKNFQIRERARLEFRAEWFNASNSPIYGQPGTGYTSASFGVVVPDQTNLARVGQVALRLVF